MSTSPKKPSAIPAALIAAWRRLYPDPDTKWPGDPGARAALRRAATPEALLVEPAFHALLHRMKALGVDFGAGNSSSERYLRLALVAGVLAERRGTQSALSSFMHAVGGSPDADDRKLSALRFQALMTALDKGTGEEKMRTLRRVMTMAADKDFNLHAFARDLINWSDDARIDWTFDYFGKHHQPVAAKAETQSTDSEEQLQ